MPTKKKKTKKIKKLSTSKALYADYRTKKEAARGYNKAMLRLFKEDAGKGFENFDKAFYVNVFDEAGKVKTYKQLQHFIDRFIPSITPADIALAALNHAKDKWNVVKILNDPEQKESVLKLLDHVDKNTAAKTYASIALVKFVSDTGYKRPKEITTFKGHITMFKDYFGLKRKKKKVPLFKDREFKI